jgi:GntR family transcriptional regulator, transcriptional repressor for pyruvate dehydrogenase complex
VTGRRQAVIEHFERIEVARPADVIIRRVRELISSGVLKPGDRLPPERALAERFGVGRGHIREALKRLEFYGILRTLPQSGTVVASLGVRALERLIANVLDLDGEDFESLMETRGVLEVHSAARAALHACDAEIEEIGRALAEFRAQVARGGSGLEEDLMFHLRVAEAAHSPVLRSLISLITPDVITQSKDRETCAEGRHRVALAEHEAVFEAIRARDPGRAAAAMAEHMRMSQQQARRRGVARARPGGGRGAGVRRR